MSLKKYREKRDFKKTQEPSGKTGRFKKIQTKKRLEPMFVVQKHAASHLHYDFRLEMQGVLKSWAVPKGPSLNPSAKRLAVEVEDHPLEYGGFEGVIPQGEYGGGTVMLWDRGHYQSEKDPYESYKKGDITLQLEGEKLKGLWKLIRIKNRLNDGKNHWLLFKMKDNEADEQKDILEKAYSVLTKRSMNEIAEKSVNEGGVWYGQNKEKIGKQAQQHAPKQEHEQKLAQRKGSKIALFRDYFKPVNSGRSELAYILVQELKSLKGAVKRHVPETFRPQLAKLTDSAPEGDDWIHEIKFDGYRILARHNSSKIELLTRNGLDWGDKFTEVLEQIKTLPLRDYILDGELIATDQRGMGNFQKLQNYLIEDVNEYIKYYVFDLPYCAGYDLTKVPLIERKRILKLLFDLWSSDHDRVAYTDHIVGNGSLVYQGTCQLGLEGSVSKKMDSVYEQKRTSVWLKNKCHQRQEFVIGGFTKPQGARKYFGSLLLGFYNKKGELEYCGHVGTGFSERILKDIYDMLSDIKQEASPFYALPRGVAKGVTWVAPKLVCEVEFFTRTSEGILRHPAFSGLRLDKKAKEVQEEAMLKKKSIASSISSTKKIKSKKQKEKQTSHKVATVTRQGNDDLVISGVKITHPDKIFAVTKTVSKRAIVEYYDKFSEWILPHVVNRPLTLLRCTHSDFKCFFQKHYKNTFPKSISAVNVEESGKMDLGKKFTKATDYEFLTIKNKAGLLALIQFDALEIHPWGSQNKNLEKPDRIIFDMDPDAEIPWSQVLKSARFIEKELNALGLQSFLKTSGGKGLHLVLPIKPVQNWATIKDFTHDFSRYIVQLAPDKFVSTISKKERKGKIFLDYLRNGRGATAVAAYSTRARENAPVSVPVAWDKISTIKSPSQFNVGNMDQYFKKNAKDPWEGFFECRQTVTVKMIKVLKDKLGEF